MRDRARALAVGDSHRRPRAVEAFSSGLEGGLRLRSAACCPLLRPAVRPPRAPRYDGTATPASDSSASGPSRSATPSGPTVAAVAAVSPGSADGSVSCSRT